jgi:hypothetical protein
MTRNLRGLFDISRRPSMDALLEKVIEAHGGLPTWNRFDKVEATIISGGGFFPLKGFPTDTIPRRLSAWLHEERNSLQPFGAPDMRMSLISEVNFS